MYTEYFCTSVPLPKKKKSINHRRGITSAPIVQLAKHWTNQQITRALREKTTYVHGCTETRTIFNTSSIKCKSSNGIGAKSITFRSHDF